MSTKTLRFYVFIPRIGQILCVDRFFSEFCTNADADRRSAFPISEINIQDPFVLNHNIASKIAPRFVQILKSSSQFVSTTCNRGETIVKVLSTNFQPSPTNDDHFFESKMVRKFNSSLEYKRKICFEFFRKEKFHFIPSFWNQRSTTWIVSDEFGWWIFVLTGLATSSTE